MAEKVANASLISDDDAKIEENISVSVRMRPLNARELKANNKEAWVTKPDTDSVFLNPDIFGKAASVPQSYDNVFHPNRTTDEVYDRVARSVVTSCLGGINGTIFAYGQTASGKTHTMQGDDEHPGILPLAATQIFEEIAQMPHMQFLLHVSYIEVYNEQVKDLLSKSDAPLRIREDRDKGFYVENVAKASIISVEQLLQTRDMGEERRHVGVTNMNEKSSRSHTIFTVTVEMRLDPEYSANDDEEDGDKDPENTTLSAPEAAAAALTASEKKQRRLSEEDYAFGVRVGQLNLVDLAGSENARQTGAAGSRLKEGANINKSLLTLSRVISQLAQSKGNGNTFINFRDSKLTQILQPSLAGNCRTAVVCCVTPASQFMEETKSTLSFASRAKEIRTKAVVNEILDEEAEMKKLKRTIQALKSELASQQSERAEKGQLEAKLSKLTNLFIHGGTMVVADGGDHDSALLAAANDPNIEKQLKKRKKKKHRETWCPGGNMPAPHTMLREIMGDAGNSRERSGSGGVEGNSGLNKWGLATMGEVEEGDEENEQVDTITHTPIFTKRQRKSEGVDVGRPPSLDFEDDDEDNSLSRVGEEGDAIGRLTQEVQDLTQVNNELTASNTELSNELQRELEHQITCEEAHSEAMDQVQAELVQAQDRCAMAVAEVADVNLVRDQEKQSILDAERNVEEMKEQVEAMREQVKQVAGEHRDQVQELKQQMHGFELEHAKLVTSLEQKLETSELECKRLASVAEETQNSHDEAVRELRDEIREALEQVEETKLELDDSKLFADALVEAAEKEGEDNKKSSVDTAAVLALEASLAALTKENEQLKHEAGHLEEALVTNELRLEKMEASKSEELQKLQKSNDEAKNVEAETKDKQVETVTKDLETLRTEVDERIAEVKALQEAKHELEERMEVVERVAQDSVVQAEEDARRASEQLEQLKQLQNARDVEEVLTDVVRSAVVACMEQDLAVARDECAQQTDKLVEMDTEKRTIQEQLVLLEGEREGLRVQVLELQAEVCTLGELAEQQTGDKTQAATQQAEAIRELLSALENKEKDLAVAQCIVSVVGEAVATVEQDEHARVRVEANELRLQVISLEQQLFDAQQGSRTVEGQLEDQLRVAGDAEQVMQRLNEQLDAERSACETLKEEVTLASNRVEMLELQAEDVRFKAREQIASDEEVKDALEEQLVQAVEASKALTDQLEAKTCECEALEAKMSDSVSGAQNDTAELNASVESLREELKDKTAECFELQTRVEDARVSAEAAGNKLGVKQVEAEEEKALVDAQVEELRSSVIDLNAQVESARSEIEAAKVQLVESADTCETLQAQVVEAQNKTCEVEKDLNLQLTEARERVDVVEKELKKKTEECVGINEELDEFQENTEVVEAQLQAKTNEFQALVIELAAVKGSMGGGEAALAEKVSECDKLQAEVSESASRVKSLEKQVEVHSREREELQQAAVAELAVVKELLDGVQAALAGKVVECETLEAEVSESAVRMQALEEQIVMQSRENEEYKEAALAVKESMETVQAELADKVNECEKLQAEVLESAVRVSALEEQMEEQSRVGEETAVAKLAAVTASMDGVQVALAEKVSECEKLQVEMSELAASGKALEEQMDVQSRKFDAQSEAAIAELAAVKDSMDGGEAALADKVSECEKLQVEVSELTASGKTLEEQMEVQSRTTEEKNETTLAEFAALNASRDEVQAALAEKVSECEKLQVEVSELTASGKDLEEQLEVQSRNYEAQSQAAVAELAAVKDSMGGGEAALADKVSECEKLQVEVSELVVRSKTLEEQLEVRSRNSDEQKEAAVAELAEVKGATDAVQANLVEKVSECDRLQVEVSESAVRVQALEEELESSLVGLQEEVSALKEQLVAATEDASTAKAELIAKSEAIVLLETQLADKVSEYEKLAVEARDTEEQRQASVASVEEEMAALKEQLGTTTSEHQALVVELAAVKDSMGGGEAALAEKVSECEKLQVEVTESAARVVALEEQLELQSRNSEVQHVASLAGVQEEVVQLKEQLVAATQDAATVQAQLTAKSESVVALEIELADAESKANAVLDEFATSALEQEVVQAQLIEYTDAARTFEEKYKTAQKLVATLEIQLSETQDQLSVAEVVATAAKADANEKEAVRQASVRDQNQHVCQLTLERDTLTSELQEAQRQLQASVSTNSASNSDRDVRDEQLVGSTKRVGQLEQNVDLLQQQLDKARENLNAHQQEMKDATGTFQSEQEHLVQEIEKEQQVAKQHLQVSEQLRAILRERDDTVAKLKHEVEGLERHVHTIEAAGAEAANDAAVVLAAAVGSEGSETKSPGDVELTAAAHAKSENLERELSMKDATVSELNNRVARLQKQLDGANAMMLEGAELPSQLAQARAQLAEVVMERDMLIARVEEASDALNASKARAVEAERLVNTLRDDHRRAVSELTSALTEAHMAVETKMSEVKQVQYEAKNMRASLEQAQAASARVGELEVQLKDLARKAAAEHNDTERTKAAAQEAVAQRDDLVAECADVQKKLDTMKVDEAGLKQRVAIKDARIAKLEQSKITKQIVNKMNKIKDDNKRMKKRLVEMDSAYGQLQEQLEVAVSAAATAKSVKEEEGNQDSRRTSTRSGSTASDSSSTAALEAELRRVQLDLSRTNSHVMKLSRGFGIQEAMHIDEFLDLLVARLEAVQQERDAYEAELAEAASVSDDLARMQEANEELEVRAETLLVELKNAQELRKTEKTGAKTSEEGLERQVRDLQSELDQAQLILREHDAHELQMVLEREEECAGLRQQVDELSIGLQQAKGTIAELREGRNMQVKNAQDKIRYLEKENLALLLNVRELEEVKASMERRARSVAVANNNTNVAAPASNLPAVNSSSGSTGSESLSVSKKEGVVSSRQDSENVNPQTGAATKVVEGGKSHPALSSDAAATTDDECAECKQQ